MTVAKQISTYSWASLGALTGESLLREVGVGEEVLSGFINKNSVLTVRVDKEFEESTVSKILDYDLLLCRLPGDGACWICSRFVQKALWRKKHGPMEKILKAYVL